MRLYKYLFVCTIALLLTACMGESEEKISIQEYGVATLGARKNIRTESGFLITAPEIEAIADLKEGDCFLLEYKTVYETLSADEETQVDIYRLDSISSFPLMSTITDTALIFNNEEILRRVVFDGSRYVQGYLFMQTQHGLSLEGEKEYFDLSYDSGKSPVEESEKPLYDLFLRVVKEEGTDTLRQDKRYITAFDIKHLVDNAQTTTNSKGEEAIALRLNYASGFDAEAQKLRWTTSDTLFLLK